MENQKRMSFEDLKLKMQNSKQEDLTKITGGILGSCHPRPTVTLTIRTA